MLSPICLVPGKEKVLNKSMKLSFQEWHIQHWQRVIIFYGFLLTLVPSKLLAWWGREVNGIAPGKCFKNSCESEQSLQSSGQTLLSSYKSFLWKIRPSALCGNVRCHLMMLTVCQPKLLPSPLWKGTWRHWLISVILVWPLLVVPNLMPCVLWACGIRMSADHAHWLQKAWGR